MRPIVRCSALIAGLGLAVPGAAQEAPGGTGSIPGQVLFRETIQPILAANCHRCHSAAAEHLEGGLRLDHRRGWESGGRSGPAVVPGHPERSLLIRAVRQRDPDLVMPPKGRLNDAEITALERWIEMGALDAGEVGTAAAPEGPHWAFAPLGDAAPPRIRRQEWPRNEIDRFVLAELEARGLEPAPGADRRTLLRRLSFDLLGLPPSSEQVRAFVAAESPDAYEREVERMLASPHYGERWGRRWLDVARYADSNGSGDNLAMAHAFEYRDWVVRALNQDMPFDRFLTMQVAGDLLVEAEAGEPGDGGAAFDAWIATAFLALGPKDLSEVDKPKLEMDVIDEQIDVVTRGFLGLSVACARCHDHKFDPVRTEDYYALAGVFKSTRTMERFEAPSRWYERQIATPDEIAENERWEQSVAALEAELGEAIAQASETVRATWRGRLRDYLLAGQTALEASRFVEAEDFSSGNLLVDAEEWGTPRTTVVRTDSPEPQFAEYELVWPIAERVRLDARFAGVRSRPLRLLLNGALLREDGLAETTAAWDTASQAWFEVAELELKSGLNRLRLETADAVPHIDKLLLAPPDVYGSQVSEGLVAAVVRNWASLLDQTRRQGSSVFAAWHAASLEEGRAVAPEAIPVDPLIAGLFAGGAPRDRSELADRYARALLSVATMAAEGAASEAEAEMRGVIDGPESPFALPAEAMECFFSDAQRRALERQRARLAEARAAEPVLRRTLAVAEGEPQDVPVHIGGSHLELASTAVRRGPPASFGDLVPIATVPPEASGRLELARWLTHPEHPLTSRVIVNRVWQGHFGHGLVRSPSDFGLRGERPTHPALLDRLAREFVREGWSLKALHRKILLSSTYRMRSLHDPAGAAIDPENHLLWRQNRRRLEAEPLRDAILAVSGRLDPSLGGSSLAFENAKAVTSQEAEAPVRYESTRRSLYLPVIRNAVYGFFSSFDYPDASVTLAGRPATVTVQQAFALMNGPLVVESSEALARRLFPVGSTIDRNGVERLYLSVLGRAPLEDELRRALAFLREMEREASAAPPDAGREAWPGATARLRAWRGLAQVLLSSNEFLYVD